MGVALHILDRRTVLLKIGGTEHEIGALRQAGKLTELDVDESKEAERAAQLPSPAAVLVAEALKHTVFKIPKEPTAAHPVLGWDEGRGSVTDLGWDYLPVLGYAVRDASRDLFVLHELRDDALFEVTAPRAAELGLFADGRLVRKGQPIIVDCSDVRPFIEGYVEADCVLADGRQDKILARVIGERIPTPAWFIGRKPRDAVQYPIAPGVIRQAS